MNMGLHFAANAQYAGLDLGSLMLFARESALVFSDWDSFCKFRRFSGDSLVFSVIGILEDFDR